MTLAGAAFAYVTAEMLPVGLLSEVSTDLDVTEGRVGLLLTFYAYGVAVLTLPLIGAVKTWPRRRVVVLTVATLAVSQLVAALAVNYPMLVIGRLLCAATHGVFWAVVAPVAATLVPRGQQGKAIAMVYAGTSLAFVLGGPCLRRSASPGVGGPRRRQSVWWQWALLSHCIVRCQKCRSINTIGVSETNRSRHRR